MNVRSIAWWCALSCLLLCLSGCTTGTVKKDGLIDKYRIPTHFQYIPADTAFVVTDFSPLPYDEFESFPLESMSDMVSLLRKNLSKDIANLPPDAIQMEQRLVMALLDEFDGNVSVEGFKRMGMATQGHFAFYSIGAFPVLRAELSDSKKYEAVFSRVEAKLGKASPRKTLGSMSYRSYEFEDFVIPVIITDREVITGFTHKNFESDYLAYVTGAKKFEKTLATDNKLLTLVKKYKFSPYMAGYIDLEGIGAALLGTSTSSMLRSSLETSGVKFPNNIPPECVSEISALLKDSPRIVYGYDQFTRKSVAASIGLETTSPFMKGVASTIITSQAYDSPMDKKALFSMHMGFDLKKLIAVLRDQAQSIQSQPFKCDVLQDLNGMAREAYFSASNLPAWALDLQGLSVILGDIDLDIQQSKLNSLKLLLMVRSANPANLFSFIKPFLPELSAVTLTSDGAPVSFELPAQLKMVAPKLAPPHVAMTKDHLALAVGEGVLGNMTQILKAGAANSPMMSFGYDLARFGEIFSAAMPTNALSGDEGMLLKSVMKLYTSFGQTRFNLDVNANGVFSQTSLEFIPKKKTTTK